MSNQSRVPAGVSAGGRFAPTHRAEPDAALAAPVSSETEDRVCSECGGIYDALEETGLDSNGDGDFRCPDCGDKEATYWAGQYAARGRSNAPSFDLEAAHAAGVHDTKLDPSCRLCAARMYGDH